MFYFIAGKMAAKPDYKKTLTELYVEKHAARHHMLHMYGTGTHVQVRTF